MPAAARRRVRLLLLPLLALALAALVQEAAAAKDAAPPPPDKSPNRDGGGGGKKKRPPPPAEAEPPRSPRSPKPSPPAAAPEPAPVSDPSPPPPAPPSPAPPPPPYPALKLILKITGAPQSLTEEQQQAVIAAVNGLSQAAPSYPYVFKAQTPASPTKPPLPNVRTQLPTFTPSSPPPPVPEPPSDSSGKDNKSKSSGGGNHSHKNGSGNGGGNSNSGGGNRRLLGTWVRPSERGSARALLQSKSGGICPKDSSFIVQQKEDCTPQCEALIAGKTDRYIFPTPSTDPSGSYICCDCRMKVGTPETNPAPSPSPVPTSGASDNTIWWPTDAQVTPSDVDGVYVFAESRAAPSQVSVIQQNLVGASNTGALCANLSASGVPCTSTQIYFNGEGEIVFAPNLQGTASAADASSSSSDGLSTGAIVGIVVGSCAALAAVVISISIFISCRRERTIERAAKLRTMQRRSDVPVQEESKWRQMYSARMQESMRRAEEATERQKIQGSGPSFLEMQDRAFAQEAADAERATPQRSSSKKLSFGRGTPKTDLSASPSLQRDSPEHSLMTGSELSSPLPSVTSGKAGRTRSLKKLFSSGSKG
ncbi:hypothetical protein ABPG77_000462 [Micractinium sp. CCAP 211/92]